MLPIVAKFLSNFSNVLDRNSHSQEKAQIETFRKLIKNGEKTVFGRDHNFKNINNYEQFRQNIPLYSYEDFISYIEKIKLGGQNILWPGRPLYFATTSGTTAGSKYIPITSQSIQSHIIASQKMLLHYASNSKSTNFLKGRMLFLSGSPVLEGTDILEGRLSGIVNHHVPNFLRSRHLPSFNNNSISNWDKKLEAIILECLKCDLTLISGIPPWVQMFFEKTLDVTGKNCISEVFPNLQTYVYGGVNFAPYRKKMQETIGHNIDTLESYPCSEGFIAYTDTLNSEDGILLNACSGMFFEFIPITSTNSLPITLEDIEIGINYSIILSSTAGLWRYILGDTVKFISKNPYRIVVTGRTSQYISAFGEHVIVEEVEQALAHALTICEECFVKEYTVAPNLFRRNGEKPYHEWFIEFSSKPVNMNHFASVINEKLCNLNPYYKDLIENGVIQSLKITEVTEGSFRKYHEKVGKLGGQNKTIHVSNNRNIINLL